MKKQIIGLVLALFITIPIYGQKLLAESDFSKDEILTNKDELKKYWKTNGLGTPGSVGGQFPSKPIVIKDGVFIAPFSKGDWGGAGSRNGTTIYRSSPEHEGKSIYSEFLVKFSENFSWGSKFKGGKYGVAWRVGTIKTGGIPGEGNIQIGTMWREDGRMHAYFYHNGQGSKYPKPTEEYLYGYIERGKWFKVATEIIASNPGKKDGIVRIYVNDKIAWEWKDIQIGNGSQSTVKFEPALGNFFGGDSKNWAAENDCNISYKYFRVWDKKPTDSPLPDPEPTPEPLPDPTPDPKQEQIDKLIKVIAELEISLQEEKEKHKETESEKLSLQAILDKVKEVIK